MSQVKKISIATVYGKIDLKKLLAANEKGLDLPCMRVMGCAVSSKTGESAYGNWTCLMGTFEAIDASTGEEHKAAQCYLPDIALLPILLSLNQPDCRGVEFVMDISARYINDAKPGGSVYEYIFDHVLPPDENDPISRLHAKMARTPVRAFGLALGNSVAQALLPLQTSAPDFIPDDIPGTPVDPVPANAPRAAKRGRL